MIDYKYYKEIQAIAEKNGLKSDKDTMKVYVKMCEKFAEDQIALNGKLRMKNLQGRLQNGQIAVKRKELNEHIRICKRVIEGIDETMRMPANELRGSRIAKLMNELNNTLYIFRFAIEPASTDEGQAEYEQLLLNKFNEQRDDLLLRAIADDTARHNLCFSIKIDDSYAGTANYNKREKRFDYISYCSNQYGRKIPL